MKATKKQTELTYTKNRRGYWNFWTIAGLKPRAVLAWTDIVPRPMNAAEIDRAALEAVQVITQSGTDLGDRDDEGRIIVEVINHLGQIRQLAVKP